jgi:integrase
MPLSIAKVKALGMRLALYEGREPSKRSRATGCPTFTAMCEAYIAAHQSAWRSPKEAGTWRSSLATHARKLSRLPVDVIGTNDVADALRDVWTSSPSVARKLRGRIEAVIDYAHAKGHRPTEANPARWKGRLAHLLPALPSDVKHHVAIPVAEIPALGQELMARNSASAYALLFTIINACRTGDTIRATWSEIDLASAIWSIPSGRTKAGRPFRIPLSSYAIVSPEVAGLPFIRTSSGAV